MKLNSAAERVIRALLKARRNRLDVWQLSRLCGYLPEVIQAVEHLKRLGVVRAEESAVVLQNKQKLPGYLLKKEKPLEEVMKAYARYRKRVWFNTGEYDQLELLPGAVRNKLSVMLAKNDLLGRDVLLVGDDDLFSIACSLTGLPRSITVFDVNQEVVDFIRNASSRLPIPIKTVNINLLKALPKKYVGGFDVFVTEPPDTLQGTLLFLARGIDALNKRGVFYLGMTSMTMAKKQWLELEKTALQSGIVFTDIIGDFEEYILEGDLELTWKGFEKLPNWITKPAQEPWFVSTLFRGEIVGDKKPIRFSSKNIEEALFTSFMP